MTTRRPEPAGLEVDARATEIVARCRALAACTDQPGVITRTFLSPAMRDAQALLADWMTQAGMTVRVDAAGNVRGAYPAVPAASTGGETATLVIGSHLDTVPCAGAFDGPLGVLVGVALVEALDGRRLPFAIEVIGFSEEEGVRFGVPFIGSRALAGTIDDHLLDTRDRDGVRVRDAIAGFGLDVANLAEAQVRPPHVGFLEFHIEQGPVLDDAGESLALVDAIAGQSRLEVAFTGVAAHAGTTPMRLRRDGLAAAAEWIAAVEREAHERPALVATVGRLQVEPGAGNVVAGRCLASLDVRHADDRVRGAAVDALRTAAQRIGAARGIDVAATLLLDQPAVPMDSTLLAALDHAGRRAGLVLRRMTSGAGHDAMVMARAMPAAMLFVRSPGGVSHHPDESVSGEDVAAALRVGLHALDVLAESWLAR
jgi:allantoate deiminase